MRARAGVAVHTLVGLKFAMTSLTGEVTLAPIPKVRVMFNWGASAGDDSTSTSIGVPDIVVHLSSQKNAEQKSSARQLGRRNET